MLEPCTTGACHHHVQTSLKKLLMGPKEALQQEARFTLILVQPNTSILSQSETIQSETWKVPISYNSHGFQFPLTFPGHYSVLLGPIPLSFYSVLPGTNLSLYSILPRTNLFSSPLSQILTLSPQMLSNSVSQSCYKTICKAKIPSQGHPTIFWGRACKI